MRKTPKSVRWKQHLRKVLRLIGRAETLLYCPAVKKVEIEWTAEEIGKLREAQNLMNKAKEKLEAVLAERIGKQAVREARHGDRY